MDSPPAIIRPPLPSPSAGGLSISDSSPLLPILAVLAFISLVVLIYAFFFALRCPPNPFNGLQRRSGASAGGRSRLDANGQRVDRVISSVAYEKDSHGTESGGECPVCLVAFAGGEVVRQVNVCKHLFHAPCIDTWLASHSSCPVCRAVVATKRPKPRPVAAVGENDLRQGLPDSASLV
ncbi:hypothetical protein NMG60_11000384 [Bertholletia excelsa]